MSRVRKHTHNGILGLLVIAAVPLLMAQGCPPPTENNPPTANAGTDQAVSGGAAVTLNATASSDPDGDALSYFWTQNAGTTVALSDTLSPTPSFTAPNTSETLVFNVEVTDGNGGSDSDQVSIVVTAAPAGGVNNDPIADAGPDQTVTGGTTVALSGFASFDPDGDPLSFSWSQTAGTPVTLSDPTSSSPSFTAPNSNEILSFSLTVSDGQGGSSTDSVDITVIQAAGPKLYIANFIGNSVTSYDITDPNAINGNIAPDANLAGAQTGLALPTALAIDAGGALLVNNFTTDAITGYFDALNLASINGNVAPTRNVQGAATQFNQPWSLTLNDSDMAFVGDLATDRVYVFDGASTAAFNGNVPPTRTINSANIVDPRGLDFDANDSMYVANNVVNNITVFANASSLNGVVAATRTINSAVFGNVFDVHIDANDTMYVVSTAGRVDMFFNAAILNGNVTPDVSLLVQGALFITSIEVDTFGTAYITDFTNNAVYSYDNITTRNGTLPPDRVLQGANTQLNRPIYLYLEE